MDIEQIANVLIIKQIVYRIKSDLMSHRTGFGDGVVSTKHRDIGTRKGVVVGIMVGDGVGDGVFSLNESIKSYPSIGDTDQILKLG